MKNVYLYIVFLLLSVNSFGQDLRNSNWLFGDKAWLKFSTNPNSVTSIDGSAMKVWEGCASVSDQNGNLLFYSNGTTIWNKNHLPMTNGNNTLTSTESNSQGVIIVPKPGSIYRYYVVYIDGVSGNRKGLYYSEVDMTNGIGQVILSTRNTVLKDHNNVNIDINYSNESEKLTSTIHSNGIDYWIITQIRDQIYSYKVTSGGIGTSNMPNSNTAAPVTLITNGNGASAGTGCMKISPNGQRIGIAYNSRISAGVAYGGIVLGSFNSSTGNVTLGNVIPTYQKNPYGLEFSPNSQNVYFTHEIISPWISELYKMTSPTAYTFISSINGNGASLQLGIDEKIYLTTFSGNKISVIYNPDNVTNPNFQNEIITLSSGWNYGGLPQLVPWQDKCPTNLVLISTIQDVSALSQDNRQASNTITASNVINNGAIGIYHAGEDIVLKPGFYSANGSKFRGYIEGCSDQFVGLKVSGEEEEMSLATIEAKKELFTLYPNPASENVTISSDKVMQNITVTSLDGFTLFQGDIKRNSYEHNVSNYRKGIYVITVVTEDGEMEMKKLMKE